MSYTIERNFVYLMTAFLVGVSDKSWHQAVEVTKATRPTCGRCLFCVANIGVLLGDAESSKLITQLNTPNFDR